MKYSWNFKKIDSDRVAVLAQKLQLSALVTSILINRNLDTSASVKKFFHPTLTDLYDPFLMKDMDIAVSRLDTALKEREKVLIFGDYDVDGTTGAALLYLYLNMLGLDPIYYIPDREREGYGMC